jgi:hypothetical protein
MWEPATYTLQDEFDEILGKLRDAAPDPAHPVCTVEGRHLLVRLEATAGEDGFTVTVTVTAGAGHPARSGDQTLAIEVDGRFFLSLLDQEGKATFRSVPPGRWSPWWIRGQEPQPGEEMGIALPRPRRRTEFAAAGEWVDTAVMQVALPDGYGTLTLHHERDQSYLVEIDRGHQASRLIVITVKYGKTAGGAGLVVIPVRRSALARLDGFDHERRWRASIATETRLPVLSAVSVVSSVRAAANNATRRAWSDLGDLVPEIRPVIERELEG